MQFGKCCKTQITNTQLIAINSSPLIKTQKTNPKITHNGLQLRILAIYSAFYLKNFIYCKTLPSSEAIEKVTISKLKINPKATEKHTEEIMCMV